MNCQKCGLPLLPMGMFEQCSNCWIRKETKPKRTPIQLTEIDHSLVALCNDGSIWCFNLEKSKWVRCLDIPQDSNDHDDKEALSDNA